MSYYASYRFEKVHPLQCGLFRRKVRTTRRPEMPLENPLVFHLRRAWEIASTYLGLAKYWLFIERLRRRVERDPAANEYTDLALEPVDGAPQILTIPAAEKSVEQKRRRHAA
jgi:hypothetical protein